MHAYLRIMKLGSWYLTVGPPPQSASRGFKYSLSLSVRNLPGGSKQAARETSAHGLAGQNNGAKLKLACFTAIRGNNAPMGSLDLCSGDTVHMHHHNTGVLG